MATLIARLNWIRREVLGLNRRSQELMLRYNRPALTALVDHKVRTKEVLAKHGLPTPRTLGVYRKQHELAGMRETVERHREFVLKPARGAGGEGVVVVVGRSGEHLLKASGDTLPIRDLLAQAGDIIGGAFSLSQSRDEAVLEDRLAPDDSLARYSSGGIPDLRILVVHGVPLMAMLRLPTKMSDGRANLHVGGVGVGIDLQGGRAVHAMWQEKSIVTHPDTNQPLPAIQVPGWNAILQLAARAHDAVPLGYMGIDIVIDRQHGPMILELNARPGLAIQLANHRGLRSLLAELERQFRAGLDVAERVDLGIQIAKSQGRDERLPI